MTALSAISKSVDRYVKARCEGEEHFADLTFQCHRQAEACPKCGQMTQFCLECMKLASESDSVCQDCIDRRLAIEKASTPENVERLVDALKKFIDMDSLHSLGTMERTYARAALEPFREVR